MPNLVRAVTVIALFLFAVLGTAAGADCNYPVLAQQKRDAATILKLEGAWTLAYLTGDTEFERCLLTSDFTAIMSDGSIDHLSEELALADKNKGKSATSPNLPPITVYLHGDVAVAYGISSEKLIDGKPHKMYYADYYVWNSGVWHAYFAQQTSFPVKGGLVSGSIANDALEQMGNGNRYDPGPGARLP